MFKNSTNKTPALSHKTLVVTLPAQVRTLDLRLPHAPYSLHFAPSDSHIFGPQKDALRRRRFADDDELKHGVREDLLRLFSKELRRRAYGVSRNGGKSVLIMKEPLWENNINFVNDVPMIYRVCYDFRA